MIGCAIGASESSITKQIALGCRVPLEVEFVAIGEISGRWKTSLAEEDERRNTSAILEEIASSKFEWNFVDYKLRSFSISVELLHNKKEYPPLAGVRKRGWMDRLMPPSYLKLTSQISYSDEVVDSFVEPGTPDTQKLARSTLEHMVKDVVLEEFGGVLLELLLAANIARPGSLHFGKAYLFTDGKFSKNGTAGTSGLSEAFQDSLARGWPKFNPIEMQSVLRWLSSVPGFRARHTESRLGRALAAATHLFSDGWGSSRELGLVWSLLGLEALYARGSQGLQTQLQSKTEAFLGPRDTHKKDFASMYDFRSRFLHGDIDITYAHGGDATPDAEKFHDARWESEKVAMALLFATFQRMCAEGRTGLEFQYALSPKEKGES